MNITSPLGTTTHRATPQSGTRTWQRMVGVVLAVHAVAHLAGTTQAVAAIDDDRSVDALGGLVTLDTTAPLTIWAVTWVVLALLTGLAAAWTLLERTSARRVVVLAASLSLVACVIGLWATAVGIVVNAGVLVSTRLPIWSRR